METILDSIFIALLFMSLIIQLVSFYNKSIAFTITALMMWLVVFVQSLWIEVPYAVSTPSGVTTGTYTFQEYGLSALSLAFVFIDVVMLILMFMDWRATHL